MRSILEVTTVLPDYRDHLHECMVKASGGEFHLFAGREGFDPTTTTRLPASSSLTLIPNRYLFRRRLLWQRVPFRELLTAPVVLAEVNPRILSTWLMLIARRLVGRRTLLCGHAWPRSGRHLRSEQIRHLQRRLASGILVYTETEAQELQPKMGKIPVVAAPNALYSEDEAGPAIPPAGVPSTFLYVGRLIPAKKPALLLRAFAAASSRLSPEVSLVMVGDGPERPSLEAAAQAFGIADRVRFEGHITGIEKLQSYYAEAIASVSPGYVGLSLIQSLGFGVPMLYGEGEPHAPEIEAAIADFTARSFRSEDADELADGLVRFAQERDEWAARRGEIAQWCSDRYSIESKVRRVLAMVHAA